MRHMRFITQRRVVFWRLTQSDEYIHDTVLGCTAITQCDFFFHTSDTLMGQHIHLAKYLYAKEEHKGNMGIKICVTVWQHCTVDS